MLFTIITNIIQFSIWCWGQYHDITSRNNMIWFGVWSEFLRTVRHLNYMITIIIVRVVITDFQFVTLDFLLSSLFSERWLWKSDFPATTIPQIAILYYLIVIIMIMSTSTRATTSSVKPAVASPTSKELALNQNIVLGLVIVTVKLSMVAVKHYHSRSQ